MIGIDTNVLLRFLLKDDARQSARAARFMRDEISAAQPGYVSLVTLLEVVWVLDSLYGFNAEQQMAVVEDLLAVESLEIAERVAVARAVATSRDRRADFQDCLVAILGESAGCSATVTFDTRAVKRAGMVLLK
jgi:predicted nucleic-acid-binding protein